MRLYAELQSTAIEAGEHLAEPGHRPAAHRQRRVGARPAQAAAQPADLLLGDAHRREPSPADVEREAAELAERVADALEQLGVLG